MNENLHKNIGSEAAAPLVAKPHQITSPSHPAFKQTQQAQIAHLFFD